MQRQCLTSGKSSLSSSPFCFFSPLPPPPGVFFLLPSPPSPPLGKPPPVNPLDFPLVPHPSTRPRPDLPPPRGSARRKPSRPRAPSPFSCSPTMSPAWHGQALSGTPRPLQGMLRSSDPASALGPAPLDLISLPVHPAQCSESRVRRSLRSPDPHPQSGPSAVTHLQLPQAPLPRSNAQGGFARGSAPPVPPWIARSSPQPGPRPVPAGPFCKSARPGSAHTSPGAPRSARPGPPRIA